LAIVARQQDNNSISCESSLVLLALGLVFQFFSLSFNQLLRVKTMTACVATEEAAITL
jgi:hypothetical protein